MKKIKVFEISMLLFIMLILAGCSNQNDKIKGVWQEKNDAGSFFNFLEESVFNIKLDGNIVEAGKYNVLNGSQVKITAAGPALSALVGSETDVGEFVFSYRLVDQNTLILTDDTNHSMVFIRK